jgi:hypothetical protein
LALAGIMLGTATCKSCHVNIDIWKVRSSNVDDQRRLPSSYSAKGPMHESSSITKDRRKLTSIKVYLATCIFFYRRDLFHRWGPHKHNVVKKQTSVHLHFLETSVSFKYDTTKWLQSA